MSGKSLLPADARGCESEVDAVVCANCGERLHGPFCSACGQENRNPARIPLSDLFRDWLGDTFTFDSRILRTLGPLVRRPGLLTLEYLAGRRARYVPPLRLFIFLSLVMFLVLAFAGPKFAWRITGDEGKELLSSSSPVGEDGASETPELEELPADLRDPEEVNRRLLDRAPQAVFVLVPVFALFVWLFHRRRERLYMPHLIFSLHLHSFVFLAVLAMSAVNAPFPDQRGPGKIVMALALPSYLYLAQRRVYGGGRLANVLRTAGLLVLHLFAWVLLMLGVLGLVIWLA